jgi:TonB family protein
MQRTRLAMAGLLLFLLPCASSAAVQDDKWFRVVSPHFVLYTDISQSKGVRLLTDFEGRVAALEGVLGKVPDRQFPVEVFLFGGITEFADVVLEKTIDARGASVPVPPRGGPTLGTPTGQVPAPDHVAYIFKGPDRVFIAALDESPNTINNEVGHALGHLFFERYVLWRPFWLAEGAADYFRKVAINPDTKAIAEKDRFPVSDLLEIVPSSSYEDSGPPGPFRVQSYRLFRLLLEAYPGELRAYLKSLGAADGGEARLSVSADRLESRFQSYTETQVKPGSLPAIKSAAVGVTEVDIQRGDLMLAAGRSADARRWYSGNGMEAESARAILSRFTLKGSAALGPMDQAARRLVDSGLVQFHFGSLETSDSREIGLQVQALERAVRLLPLFGRAYAELARVYVLNGEAGKALPSVDKAIELEPEFADHFFVIRTEALLALKRPAEASSSAKLAASLPHADSDAARTYAIREATLLRRVDEVREAAESAQMEELRRELEKKAADLEPPKPQQRRPEPLAGSIAYSIESRVQVTVVQNPYPVFPDALVQKGTAGKIVLQVNVGVDGRVTDATIASSEIPALNASAIAAAKRWTFRTVQTAGRSVPFTITLTFQYSTR